MGPEGTGDGAPPRETADPAEGEAAVDDVLEPVVMESRRDEKGDS